MAARRRVVWTPEARRTLDEAISYVARDSPESALRVMVDAVAAAHSLRRLSLLGRVVPERADPSIREILVHRYRLMYRVKPESVEVIAFIHGARDFEL